MDDTRPDDENAAIRLGTAAPAPATAEGAPRTEPMWAMPSTEEPVPAAAADETSEPHPDDAGGEPHLWFWDAPRPGAEPHEQRGRLLRAALAWFIAATLGAGAGAGAAYLKLNDGVGEVRVVEAPVRGSSPLPANAAALVAEAVLPSIVQLGVTGVVGEGLGSGVIYSSDGYIITNNHVIEGADEILVNLPNGDQLPGSVIGSAANIDVDIAVVKVAPTEPLTPATLGSTQDLRVGDLAVAIGSPFGLSATVTAGIISALHRNDQGLGGQGQIRDAIQTDAPINPGNSGGALANGRGEVIGINTAILSGGGGNVGVGFAIPVEIARKVTEQIIRTGRAQLAFLGVAGDNLPGGKGARVRTVTPGSAAAAAEILPGDVIVSLDGKDVASMDQLITLLISHDVGDRIKIVVQRGSRRLTLTATLQARPERG